jgi:copper chaperone CopZ
MFLSNVLYWTSKQHLIINVLKNNLPIFNDYFVENFHSSLKHQTAESNLDSQIIQKAKIIDIKDEGQNSKKAINKQLKLY